MQLPSSLIDLARADPHRQDVEAFFGVRQADEGEWRTATPPAHTIALCFTNRCGSTFVASELSAHGFCGAPNRFHNYEFFNASSVIEPAGELGLGSLAAYAEHASVRHRSASGIFMTKAGVSQLAWLLDAGVIGRRFVEPLFVHVVRRDLLGQAISHSIARQTKKWTSLHTGEAPPPEFRPREIKQFVAALQHDRQLTGTLFEAIGVEPVTFVYEEVVADPSSIPARVAERLGVGVPPRQERTLAIEPQRDRLNARFRSLMRPYL